ncbi:MAG: hypothetical protein Q9160_003431 [Pyrenula sp. 1 TL-2023]
MTEAVGIETSILTLAEAGIRITAALYGFRNVYVGVDFQTERITGALSVTSALLNDLGKAMEEHHADLQKLERWSLFQVTISACKRDFYAVDAALKFSRRSHAANGKREFNQWERFKWALRGGSELVKLSCHLEISKVHLHLILEATRFDILKRLERS